MSCGDGMWEAAGAAATPAAFYLGLCRLRGSYPPPAAAKTILYRHYDGAAGLTCKVPCLSYPKIL